MYSDDLSKLFQRIGDNPQDYRQIVREDSVLQARERWPLLASMGAELWDELPHRPAP
ncbi:cellulose biosynthesis protein BcsP [Cupriavidus basilensis]|uniref:Cellulose biosynthesis protein BcsP n=1 Tax=Cupriavidus basilensis TaxID=68895 RepID=A0ABT6ANI6_9BURK|nr:cellulose biosynthesis protein BcsP [Cupriavidus basilensis]MDF3834168.1 cellulose biosynthesis protein BcsP [Cupriavidus basilensis]